MTRAQLARTCRHVEQQLRADPAFAHTRSFLVTREGRRLYDADLGDDRPADVFSVTKTVVAVLTGIALRDGVLPADLDTRLIELLPALDGAPAARHTVRQLLTMTRGAATTGESDVDRVMARSGSWSDAFAWAPQVARRGSRFEYDNGGPHLLATILQQLLGADLETFAAERLFAPLGIDRWRWTRDPENVPCGFGHLALAPTALERIGRLLLDRGVWEGVELLDPGFAAAMTSRQVAGGAPEYHDYGFLAWVGEGYCFAAGWAGNHVVVAPRTRTVIVITGDPQFDPGPPPRDALQAGWRPGFELISREVLSLVL